MVQIGRTAVAPSSATAAARAASAHAHPRVAGVAPPSQPKVFGLNLTFWDAPGVSPVTSGRTGPSFAPRLGSPTRTAATGGTRKPGPEQGQRVVQPQPERPTSASAALGATSDLPAVEGELLARAPVEAVPEDALKRAL